MAKQIHKENYLHISDEERWRHDALFFDYGPDSTGLLEGERAKELFAKSKLPESELDHIWRLADFNRDNKLDEAEFVIALHLIQYRISGQTLPNVLPPPLRVKPCNLVTPTPASPNDCEAYVTMFKYLSSNEATHLDGIKVGRVMSLSSLPIKTLARIWDLSDIDHDGKLNCHEFSTAVHLIRCCCKGMPIDCSVDTRGVLPKKDVIQSLKESRERLLEILTEKRALLSRKTELLRETSNENGGRDAASESELQELNVKLIAERTREQGVKEEIQELEKKGEARLNVHIMRVFDKTFYEKKHTYGLHLFMDIGYKPGVSGFRKDFPTNLFLEHNFVEFSKTLDVPKKRELTRKRLASERYPSRDTNTRPRPRSMAGIRAKSIGSYDDDSGSNWSVCNDPMDSTTVSQTDEQIGLSDYVTVDRVEHTNNTSLNGTSTNVPINNDNNIKSQFADGVDLGLNQKVITLPESTAVQKPFELNGRTNLPGAEKQRTPVDLSAHMSASAFYYNPDSDKTNATNDADLKFHSIRNRSNFEQREQWFSQDKKCPTSLPSPVQSESLDDPQNDSPQRSPEHSFSRARMTSSGDESKSPKLFSPLFFDGRSDKQVNRIDDSSARRQKMQEQRDSIEESSITNVATNSNDSDQIMKEETIIALDESTAQSLPTGSVPPFFDPTMQQRKDEFENSYEPVISVKNDKDINLTTINQHNKLTQENSSSSDNPSSKETLLRVRLDSTDGEKSENGGNNKPKKKVLRKVSGKKVRRPASFVGFSRLKDNHQNGLLNKDGLMRHSSEAIRVKPMITESKSENDEDKENHSKNSKPSTKHNKLVEEEHINLNARKAWLETLVSKSKDENDFDKVKRRSLERKAEKRERRNSMPSIQFTASMFEIERNLDDEINTRKRGDSDAPHRNDYENEYLTSPSKSNDVLMSSPYDSNESLKQRNDSYKSNSSLENTDIISEEVISTEESSSLMHVPDAIVKCDSPIDEKKGLGTSAFAERTKWLESLGKDNDNEIIESTNSVDKTPLKEIEAIEKIGSEQLVEEEKTDVEIELSLPEYKSDNENVFDNVQETSNDLLIDNNSAIEVATTDDDEPTILSIQERIKRLQAGKENNDQSTAPVYGNLPLKTEPHNPQPTIIENDENKIVTNCSVASTEDTVEKFTSEQNSNEQVFIPSGEVTKTTDQSRIKTPDEMKIYNIDRLEHRRRWEEKKLSREANMEAPFVSTEDKLTMSSLGESLLGMNGSSETSVEVIENNSNRCNTYTNGHTQEDLLTSEKSTEDVDYRKYVKDGRIMKEIEEQERRERELRQRQTERTESVSSESTDITSTTEESFQEILSISNQSESEIPTDWENEKLKTFGQKMSIFENNNTVINRDVISPAVEKSSKAPSSPEIEKPSNNQIWDPRAVDSEEEIIIISKSNDVECERNVDEIIKTENKSSAKPKHRMSVIERERDAERLRLIEFEEERRQRNQERLRIEEAGRIQQEELQAERMLQKAKEENLRQIQLAHDKERLQKERDEKLRRQQKTLELRALFESAPTPS